MAQPSCTSEKTGTLPSGSTSPQATRGVTVVIVTYKTAELTVECLRSVAAERAQQPQLNVRAVVVDNASGDSSTVARAMAENEWSRWVTLVTAPTNGGFAYGNNLGIEQAYADGSPDYIHLLNPDTEVRSGAIARLVDFLETHLEVGIAGSSFENLDGSDWPIAFRFPSLLSELEYGLHFGPATRLLSRWTITRRMTPVDQPVDWICGASMMIRRAVFDRIGGLDENYFLYYEETDFCRRSLEAGFKTWYVPESRVMHIMGQSTKVTNVKPGLERLPAYWFDSRRRYLMLSFGPAGAMTIDVVAVLAHSLGALKRRMLGRTHKGVPHYIRDLIRSSVIWRRNRKIPPARCAIPRL
jgi:N-acetylglucosaminyl-diphospho-decaprenol L-rhamnosyltransferase